jgi:hypothetical protein
MKVEIGARTSLEVRSSRADFHFHRLTPTPRLGQRITITASERTGEIILGFGELILEGTGKVAIR